MCVLIGHCGFDLWPLTVLKLVHCWVCGISRYGMDRRPLMVGQLMNWWDQKIYINKCWSNWSMQTPIWIYIHPKQEVTDNLKRKVNKSHQRLLPPTKMIKLASVQSNNLTPQWFCHKINKMKLQKKKRKHLTTFTRHISCVSNNAQQSFPYVHLWCFQVEETSKTQHQCDFISFKRLRRL